MPDVFIHSFSLILCLALEGKVLTLIGLMTLADTVFVIVKFVVLQFYCSVYTGMYRYLL